MWHGQEEYESMAHLFATVKDMSRRHLEEAVAAPDERFILRYEGKEALLKLVTLQEIIIGCPVVPIRPIHLPKTHAHTTMPRHFNDLSLQQRI